MSGTLQPAQTGSQTFAARNFGVTATGFGYYPPEGSRAISVQYNWGSQTGYNEDMGQLVEFGVVTSAQGVWIDNSQTPVAVTITINGTGQIITCAGTKQGFFPVFFSGYPGYQIVSNGISGTATRLIFVNTPPQCAGTWDTAATGSSSKTIAALAVTQLTTAGVAQTIVAAGGRSAGGFFTNPADATTAVVINESGVPAAGTVTVGLNFAIQPGETFIFQASPLSVSAISSDNAHNIAGERWT